MNRSGLHRSGSIYVRNRVNCVPTLIKNQSHLINMVDSHTTQDPVNDISSYPSTLHSTTRNSSICSWDVRDRDDEEIEIDDHQDIHLLIFAVFNELYLNQTYERKIYSLLELMN